MIQFVSHHAKMQYDGWAKYIQNFALKSKEIKIAKLEIANQALLILCMEFVSVFFKSRIQVNPGKKCLFSKGHTFDIFILISQCSPIMLVSSCQYHLKVKFRIYFALPSFCMVQWCGMNKKFIYQVADRSTSRLVYDKNCFTKS